MKMRPGAKFYPGAIFYHLCRWCKFGGAKLHPGAHLPLGANCAHERNLLSHVYNLILDFDKLPILSIWTCTCVINYINSSFIKLKVMTSFCIPYFIGFAGLPRRTTGISGPHDSISEQYLFITSAIEIRVCQNHGAIHESRLSDVHITSVKSFPLHNNGVPSFTIHVINVIFRQSNKWNMSPLYLTPTIWESKPLVAIDNLG